MLRPPAPAIVPEPARPGIPRHIGIIMDGNGRWAKRKHLPRVVGHRAGVNAIRPVTEECDRQGVHILTLYAFSTENWKRPKHEVNALMRLFEETIERELGELHAGGIQLRMLGRREGLNPKLLAGIEQAEQITKHNNKAILNVAFNYGGRTEIVDAVRDLAAAGTDLEALDEATFGRALYSGGLPDPDLIIRTAGEMRVSNFLLWQAAYAELYVTPTLWPDFGAADLEAAIAEFGARERKFGRVSGQNDDTDASTQEAATVPTASSP